MLTISFSIAIRMHVTKIGRKFGAENNQWDDEYPC